MEKPTRVYRHQNERISNARNWFGFLGAIMRRGVDPSSMVGDTNCVFKF